MGEVPENLEWSLPVPSVQELARQKLETVPERYIRDDTDDIIRSFDHSDHSLSVPLIDMTMLLNPQTQDSEVQKLHLACKEWGLFQLINHGIPEESLNKLKQQTHDFFALPLKEKKKWASKPGSLEGYGHAFVVSENQKLQWNDMIYLKILPVENRNLELWPDNPQSFRETLVSYIDDIKQCAASITRFIAKGLGVTNPEFYRSYEEGVYEVRINFYPACPQPERVIGIGRHADISGITLLLDRGDVPGLQVLKDGQWVFVPSIDGAIVVNLGQMTEIMSNGTYKAPDHRAVVNKSKERLSIATFCYPNSSVKIGPVEELVNSGNPPLYKNVSFDEYLWHFFNRELGVSFIDSLKF